MAASQILYPTSLAAVRRDSSLRVYETGLDGSVREAQYEGKWTGGTSNNIIGHGKIGTPVAATNLAFNKIRVYYMGTDNKLKEACWDGSGWYTGGFSYEVAAYSTVSAIFLGGKVIIRVYGQLPNNTIQEWCWDEGGKGWTVGSNLGAALPGTSIAATTWGSNPFHIRVYFQDTSTNVVEKTWDGSGWGTGGMKLANQVPRVSLGVTSWDEGGKLGIRLYYAAEHGTVIKEHAFDNNRGWYDGGFKQSCLPGSRVAAIPLPILRVYLQNGTEDSSVTEFMWNGGWSVGKAALPPA